MESGISPIGTIIPPDILPALGQSSESLSFSIKNRRHSLTLVTYK